MISFCFDEFYRRGNSYSFRISVENQRRPIYSYWLARCCVLGQDKIKMVGANQDLDTKGCFIYPVELHWNVNEWCANSQDELLVVPPKNVQQALDDRRAIILVSFAHEARVHFAFDVAGQSIFDKLQRLSVNLNLAKDQIWFVTGNRDATIELENWKVQRNIQEESFLLRIAEIASYGVGLEVRELYDNSRSSHIVLVRGQRFGDEPAIGSVLNCVQGFSQGFSQAVVALEARQFGGCRLGQSGNSEDICWNFGSLNRNFRIHRWWLLEFLYRSGLLDRGLVSFPQLDSKALSALEIEPVPSDLIELIESLPRIIDLNWDNMNFGNFIAQNSHAVSILPPELACGSGLQIVTETNYLGVPFATEKIFKTLTGQGPFVVIGTVGTLGYLQSIGVETWEDSFDEGYDTINDSFEGTGPMKRFEKIMETIVPIISDDSKVRELVRSARSKRDRNLNWLLHETKPWDNLLSELEGCLCSM